MTPITDKIKQLPDGFGIFAHAPTDAYEKPERVATSDDLKRLVSELETKTRALEAYANPDNWVGVNRNGREDANHDLFVPTDNGYDIAQAALKGEG